MLEKFINQKSNIRMFLGLLVRSNSKFTKMVKTTNMKTIKKEKNVNKLKCVSHVLFFSCFFFSFFLFCFASFFRHFFVNLFSSFFLGVIFFVVSVFGPEGSSKTFEYLIFV